ncbi:MAG: zinc-dependent peptidase [Planctomycetes bacterium]|nr:zinc-dependent peptidase [Planctomycetota bacterium]
MHPLLIILIFVVIIWGTYSLAAASDRKKKRRRALRAPFAPAWEKILQNNLPPYQKLSPQLKEQLQQYIKLFICEKSFEGCGGLTINDEIKVTIAAQACLLLLNRNTNCYSKLRTIIVYPHTFVDGKKGIINTGFRSNTARLGESWTRGIVVLSWNSVKGGATNFKDGQNVTMHEFAHQLDQADGVADGAPILKERSAYSAWARVFSEKYEELQDKAARGKKSVMNKYGATNPAEFFAVATETFFEKPRQLNKKHPELYETLQKFYEVNPVEWV